jgi:large subunit ribosomal protein L18
MAKANVKERQRFYRHKRIRKKVQGTAETPRMCVHRSLNNFYVQLIDDTAGKVIMGMSTLNQSIKGKFKHNGNIPAAAALGEIFAAELQKKGIKKVCFDRGGFLYHGRIKAFAEAARKGGMEF